MLCRSAPKPGMLPAQPDNSLDCERLIDSISFEVSSGKSMARAGPDEIRSIIPPTRRRQYMNPLANHLRLAFRSLALIGILALAASRLPGSPSAAPSTLNQRAVRSHSLIAGHPFSVRAAAAATAVFVKTDITTQGSWRGVYGAQAYSLANSAASFPLGAQLALSDQLAMTWAESTSDARALQKPDAADRFAAAWYSLTSFTIDLNLSDSAPHR